MQRIDILDEKNDRVGLLLDEDAYQAYYKRITTMFPVDPLRDGEDIFALDEYETPQNRKGAKNREITHRAILDPGSYGLMAIIYLLNKEEIEPSAEVVRVVNAQAKLDSLRAKPKEWSRQEFIDLLGE